MNARLVGLIVGVLAVIGIAVAWSALADESTVSATLAAPASGEVRADYLPDGEPVFVIGHQDGSVQVMSAFSTHVPNGLHELVWWCPSARGFDEPFHGAHWDEYGGYIFGPALGSIPSWELTETDGTLSLGDRLEPPGPDEPTSGPPSDQRDWCMALEETTYHTFEGWQAWDSPAELVEAAPEGWSLVQGALSFDDARGEVRLCSLAGCGDSAVVTTMQLPPPEIDRLSFGAGPRFIVRVRDGVVTDIARVIALPSEVHG